jgi:hypothetical protein
MVIPLLLVMALGIFDFARAFTSAITVEAAAREAADYGGLYPWFWDDSNPGVIPTTEAEMERRACSAASTLPDYEEPAGTVDHSTCTNPVFSYELIEPPGVTNCYGVPREDDPCWVKVTLVHEFRVILPLRLQFGDTELGLPSAVTLTRTSTFAVSDFEIDEDLAP